MSGTKGTKPGKRKGRVTRYGAEVVYVGASILRGTAEKMDQVVLKENITLSNLIKQTLEKEFGE
jgi:hypothetical protein